MLLKLYDSIIFDMDGTLWDAVDSYCRIWDTSFAQCGISHAPVTREELISQMGRPIEDILHTLMPALDGDKDFLELLDRNESKMMTQLGGRLYQGVAEIIPELSKTHKLFIVSNCLSDGLTNFLTFTGLTPYFTDTLTYGETGRDKGDNIAEIVSRHNLRRPVYIGDTISDEAACRKAGVNFIWAAYGFGKAVSPDSVINAFDELPAKV